MWAAGINIVLGLWMMISPSFFSLEKLAANNQYIVGPVVITFAITALWEVNRSARYGTLLAGIWMCLAPVVLDFQDSSAWWMALVTGVSLILCSLVKGRITGHYGGGWRSLFQKNPVHMHP